MNSWQYFIVLLIGGVAFATTFFIIFKMGENKRIKISIWLVTPILVLFVCAFVTALLLIWSYNFITMIFICLIIGLTLGAISGLTNYKFKHKFQKGFFGEKLI